MQKLGWSSAKSEVHNVSQRKKDWSTAISNIHKNLVNFGHAVFELCAWTDRQTDKLITIPRRLISGQVIIEITCFSAHSRQSLLFHVFWRLKRLKRTWHVGRAWLINCRVDYVVCEMSWSSSAVASWRWSEDRVLLWQRTCMWWNVVEQCPTSPHTHTHTHSLSPCEHLPATSRSVVDAGPGHCRVSDTVNIWPTDRPAVWQLHADSLLRLLRIYLGRLDWTGVDWSGRCVIIDCVTYSLYVCRLYTNTYYTCWTCSQPQL